MPDVSTELDFETSPESGPIGPRLVTALAKIGLAARQRAWQEAGPQGLTPTQGQVLALLRPRDPAGLRLSALAASLAVTPATASDAVRVLAAKGLVRKSRAADDGRALAITLTEAGRAAADHAAGWSDFLLSAIDALNPQEREVLLRALVKIIRTLQERGEIPVSRMCVTCRYFRPNVHVGSTHPHHCAFVDAPMKGRHLRLECADHQPAPPEQAERTWQTFLADAG